MLSALKTYTVLQRVFSEAEAHVADCRRRRLLCEDRDRREIRTRKAVWLYRERFLLSVVPIQWCYLPDLRTLEYHDCSATPSLHRLVMDPREDIPDEEWEDAIAALPHEMSTSLVSQASELASLGFEPSDLPTHFEFAYAANGSGHALLDELSQRFSMLDLAQASAQFTQQLAEQQDYDARSFYWTTSLSKAGPMFKPVLSTMDAIASLLGKNGSSTVKELDATASHIWFKCAGCSAADQKYANIHLGWRSFVSFCLRAFLSSIN